MPRVLVVDPDPDSRAVAREAIEASGHVVVEATTGTDAFAVLEAERPHALVLEVDLPDVSGFEVCSLVRAGGSDVPVVFLASRAGIADKSMGFAMGGDDYLTKPYIPAELRMRVDVLIRRILANSVSPLASEEEIRFGDVLLIPKAYEAYKGGKAVQLTPKEFEMLLFLCCRPTQVFTRRQIIDGVWGSGHHCTVDAVNVYIRKLREKIETNPANPSHLVTIWGVGYKFVP